MTVVSVVERRAEADRIAVGTMRGVYIQISFTGCQLRLKWLFDS